jgi:hypothetical protein
MPDLSSIHFQEEETHYLSNISLLIDCPSAFNSDSSVCLPQLLLAILDTMAYSQILLHQGREELLYQDLPCLGVEYC